MSEDSLFEPFGDAARRARLPEGADARTVLEALRRVPRVIDALVSERHALVTFDPQAPPEEEERALRRALAAHDAPGPAREHRVRVRYGAEDLDDVARLTGLSAAEVVARHAGAAYVVALVGFLPGFAYLRGLDPLLVVPRRSSPRPRIPALSVAVAGPYSAVYPFASPGGWNLLGVAVDFTPFDPGTGAALGLGDRVRFVAEPW